MSPSRHRVTRVLRHGIVSGTIPAGTRLVQASIADELAVNTATVREALRELAAEGLVGIGRRGEAIVPELCRSELEEIYQVQVVLEPVATARAAISASRHSLLRAIRLLAAMRAEPDAAAWADYHRRFHRVIDEAGSGHRLAGILENLWNRSARYAAPSITTTPGPARQTNAEDEEILRAILARDPGAAADAALRHLGTMLDAVAERGPGRAASPIVAFPAERHRRGR